MENFELKNDEMKETNNSNQSDMNDDDIEIDKIFAEKQPQKYVKFKSVMSWVLTVTAAVVLFLIISIFVRPGIVDGQSMEPNYYDGDRFLMVKDWLVDSYEYGDVVCVEVEGKILIKRIIGLPGDTITIDNSKVYRNGKEIDESEYLDDSVRTLPFGFINKYVVQEGEYFVLGDNRENSADSRMLGPVDTVIGKTWFFFRKAWFK